jgi:hypothetical protein
MTRGVTRIVAVVAVVVLSPFLAALPLAAAPAPAPPSTGPAPPPSGPAAPDATPAIRIAALSVGTRAADAALSGAAARRARLGSDLTDARAALTQAEAVSATLNVAAATAAAHYEASRAQLQKVAALTYMQSTSMSALEVLSASGDPLDASRRELLLARADDARLRIVSRARADRAEAKRTAQEAEAERGRRRARVNELERAVPPADRAVATAQTAADRAHGRLNRWLSVVNGTGTPILGAPAVTADQLAAWFQATRNRANTTVPIDQLAALFIAEGHDEGVRADVAFAQSILETGSFSYPGGGLVAGSDNNFAGVGACDSCAHGHVYPDARTGVRVQMQYLHVYADPTVTVARFAHPPVDPNMDRNFRKGQAPTWAGLTHTWATADGYADSIMRVYYEILDWVTARDR